MTRKLIWSNEDTGVFVCESEDDKSYISDPDCPLCGEKAHYWEGQVDQDFMGNDLHGWNFCCYECGIGTTIVDFD